MSYGNVLSNQRVIINRLLYFIHVKKENYIELNNFQKRFPHINKLENFMFPSIWFNNLLNYFVILG